MANDETYAGPDDSDLGEDLDERERRLTRKLESIVADLIAVVRADVPSYLEREIRDRFVAAEDLAETLDEAGIAALKRDIARRGEALATQLADQLGADMDAWFGPDVAPQEGRSMAGHSGLSSVLEGVDRLAALLLEEHGFPADEGGGYGVHYSLPAYFVERRYAPGLAEDFWKYLTQLNAVRAQRTQQDAGRRRALQRQRWDAAR